jgi:putative sterol carrier protein
MPIPFPSDDWVKALMEVLNSDVDYANTARNWEGDIKLLIEPEDSLVRPVTWYLDLWHGQCREASVLSDPNEKKAAFTLTAPLSVFVRILQGKLDPMQAMMTRQLKVNGSMVYIMKNVPTVLKFVKTCAKVDTQFPMNNEQ